MSILESLRTETRSLHDHLDHHPLMQELMSPGLTLATYAVILSKFLGFYRSIEPILAVQSLWPELGIDFEQRRKIPALDADRATLGISQVTVPLAPAPVWIQDAASALGTFYVLEGSTLGGQVITRQIRRHCALTPEHGLQFFASYGDAVGLRWKETRAALEKFAEQTHEEAAMIAAARLTFEALADWFDA